MLAREDPGLGIDASAGRQLANFLTLSLLVTLMLQVVFGLGNPPDSVRRFYVLSATYFALLQVPGGRWCCCSFSDGQRHRAVQRRSVAVLGYRVGTPVSNEGLVQRTFLFRPFFWGTELIGYRGGRGGFVAL